MATVLTHAIIKDAKDKVDAYIKTTNGLYQELTQVLTSLLGENFSGDAATGYKVFFDKQVAPALTTNLNDPKESLMAGILSILDGIEGQLLNTVDPQLGKNNADPGGQ